MFHTITNICTTALLLPKLSSADDSGFRHNLGAEASLQLAQSAPAYLTTSPDFVRLLSLNGIVISC